MELGRANYVVVTFSGSRFSVAVKAAAQPTAQQTRRSAQPPSKLHRQRA